MDNAPRVCAATKDIVLCWMPNSDLDTPSAALGLLKAEAERAGLSAGVIYSNLRFADRIGYQAYKRLAASLSKVVLGWEAAFASHTGFQTKITIRDLLGVMLQELDFHYTMRQIHSDTKSVIAELETQIDFQERELAAYLSDEADYILSMKPKIVGCSIMTQQRNASFALLKLIKERAPEVMTMVGGAICAGEAGQAFLRVAPQLDYVFSGEGDTVFAEGCRLMIEGRFGELHQKIPYFLHRASESAPICATPDLNKMALPDYSDYFLQLAQTGFESRLQPRIPVEGSRGCWWGQKGRCRFCGLHFCQDALAYREKEPNAVWQEIKTQIARYQCPRVIMTDCILSPRLIKALPDTQTDEPRATIFAECKSNLTEDRVIRLKRAGFDTLQPGIESLCDGALELMHKGNRAIKHVELLKFGEAHDVAMTWNILMGLPGEDPAWYDEMIGLMARLHHLRPPVNVWPMILMRCSVYEEEAEKFGIHTVRPQYIYGATDPDDADFTQKTAIYLRSPDLPSDTSLIARMNDAAAKWRKAYYDGASLEMRPMDGCLLIEDNRGEDYCLEYKLTGLRRAVFERAYTAVKESALASEFGEDAVAAIEYLDKRRLIVRINAEVLSLAVPGDERDG